jgi:uncharacterized protein
MKEYRISKYVERLNRGGFTALFNGLTLKKAYGKDSVIDSALKAIEEPYAVKKNQITDPLIENGFFVESGHEEIGYNNLRNKVGGINISNIVMIVDNRCNYNCKYCQIEKNMDSEQNNYCMPIPIAEKALNLFEMNSSKEANKTIDITGGEPLMNISTVKYIIERAENMPNTRTVIFTNGSLVTEGLADYFARKNTLMLVSLDGPKDIHDSVRIKKDGGGTFDESLRGYELLKKAKCKVGISSVTGKHNVDRMKEVSDLFAELNPPSIGLNFGHYLLGQEENPSIIGMARFAEILTGFYKEMREKEIFVENISRFIRPFYEEKPKLNECQAQGRGFTVDARGKIGVCKSLLVSDIISKPIDEISDDISQEKVFQEWAKRSPFTLEECIECQFIGICGGGCTYDAFVANRGDIKKIEPNYCNYTKKVLEFLVWDLFEEIKEKIGNKVYIPSIEEQERKFLKYYDKQNALQRSVGHEKDE